MSKQGGIILMKVSNVPFKGTAEQETELRKRIAEHKGEKGSLMPIMQAAGIKLPMAM